MAVYPSEPCYARNELPRRSTRPHVVLLIFFSLFLSFSLLISRSKKATFKHATQDDHDLCVPIIVLPTLPASSLHVPFLSTLSSRASGQHPTDTTRYHAAADARPFT